MTKPIKVIIGPHGHPAKPTVARTERDLLPLSDDPDKLANGDALTTCCAAAVTYHDAILCCKKCWREVG